MIDRKPTALRVDPGSWPARRRKATDLATPTHGAAVLDLVSRDSVGLGLSPPLHLNRPLGHVAVDPSRTSLGGNLTARTINPGSGLSNPHRHKFAISRFPKSPRRPEQRSSLRSPCQGTPT